MKKVYSKPEIYTVEYATNTAFCGQCSIDEQYWIDYYKRHHMTNPFAIDDACEDKIEQYCKFTYATKLMNS